MAQERIVAVVSLGATSFAKTSKLLQNLADWMTPASLGIHPILWREVGTWPSASCLALFLPLEPEEFERPTAAKMSRGSAGAGVRLSNGGEVVQFRSPAEFFAENQNIAGFDNVRRSLERIRSVVCVWVTKASVNVVLTTAWQSVVHNYPGVC